MSTESPPDLSSGIQRDPVSQRRQILPVEEINQPIGALKAGLRMLISICRGDNGHKWYQIWRSSTQQCTLSLFNRYEQKTNKPPPKCVKAFFGKHVSKALSVDPSSRHGATLASIKSRACVHPMGFLETYLSLIAVCLDCLFELNSFVSLYSYSPTLCLC